MMKVVQLLFLILFGKVCQINGDSFSEKLEDLIEMNTTDVPKFFEHEQQIIEMENEEYADDEDTINENGTEHLVQFHCINPKQTSYQVVSENDPNLESKLNISLPIVFLVHGWMNSFHGSGWMNETSRDWVTFVNTTVCSVDWAKLAHTEYKQASQVHIHNVSKEVASFIVFLAKHGIDQYNIIMAGHSLGAQIAGLVGKILQKHNIKLRAIFGLDPAGPFFTYPKKIATERRLHKDDAEFVQILHTSLSLGTSITIGDSDFWANGGTAQPGCNVNVACSHSRAHQIFRASLNPEYEFHGVKCREPGVFGYFKLSPNSCADDENSYDLVGIHGQQKKGSFNINLKGKSFPYL